MPNKVLIAVIGALVLYRDEVGPFTPDVIELAQVFAAQAAVAIENARLYRRAEDRASKLQALSAAARAVRKSGCFERSDEGQWTVVY